MITDDQRREVLHVATGSSIERLIQCASSIALPHIDYQTGYSERGREIHAFLERHAAVGREVALASVPERWRDACDALDLSGLDPLLSLTAEIAIAFDVESNTARELGRGMGRHYIDVRETEIPATLDVVGVREHEGRRIGVAVDWKSGWLTRKKQIATDWQMKFAAVCTMRLFDLDAVEVMLVNVSEGKPYVQRRTYTAAGVARIVVELRAFYADAIHVRALARQGKLPERYEIGAWCEHCPSRKLCPAQRGLVLQLLNEPPISLRDLPDADLAELRGKLVRARGRLAEALAEIDAIVASPGRGPLYLERTVDGRHRWLASVVKEGNETLVGKATFDVAREFFLERARAANKTPDEAAKIADELAHVAAPPDASKKGLGEAVRAAKKLGLVHARGGEETVKRLLTEIRKRNGARRKAAAPHVEEIIVADALPGADLPALEEGNEDG